MKPAISPRFGRLVRHSEIARREGERLARAQQQLAGLTVRKRRVVGTGDAGLHALDEMAHGAGAIGRDRACEHEIRFGRAVAVEQRHAEAFEKRTVKLTRHSAAERDPQEMRGVVGGFRLRQQHHGHRAEEIADGRLMPSRRCPETGGGKFRLERVGAAVQERLIESVQRIGVEQRQRREQHIALSDVERARRIDAPPEHLRLRTADALGRTRGAGRIEDRDRVVRPHRCGRCPLAERGQWRDRSRYGWRHGAFSDRPDEIRRRDVAFQRFDGRHKAELDHQQFRRGVAQDVAELDAAQRGVDRHGHGAHPGAAEIDFQKFRPVRAHQRDAVAGLNSSAHQAGRGCGGDRSRLGIAPSCFAEDEQRAVAVLRGLPRQNGRENPVRRREALSRLRPDRRIRPLPGRAAITCLHTRLLKVSPGWSAIDRTWPTR